MANYIVDWQSGGTQGIPRKASISLPQKVKDSTSTSLTLTGFGVNNWGEIQQENFLRLMENFASNTPPVSPTIGQLWYNTQEKILYINVDELTAGPNVALYHPQSPARWAQVFPAVNNYAGISEYSSIALAFNRIIGTPSVYGSNPDVASNQYGWGQTDLVPVYTDARTLAPGFSSTTYPATFDNSAWVILLSRLRKAMRQIGQPETLVPSVGFIDDGRPIAPGNTLANSYNNYPAQGTLPNITAGWNGNGLATMQAQYTNLIAALSLLESNRFNLAALSSQLDVLVSFTRTTSWTSTLVHSMSFTFATEDAAKAYFNAGGSLKFVWSHTGGSDTINNAWTTFLNNQSGLMLDYFGMKRGSTYVTVTPAGTTSLGFYDLTTTFQDYYRRDRQYSSYENIGDGGMRIEAKKRLSGTNFVIDINVYFTETVAPGEVIVGTTLSSVSGQKANTNNTNQPGIAQPIATSSGSFTT